MVMTPSGMTNGKQNAANDQLIEEQNEIAEHILGMVTRRDGKPMDNGKSVAWRRVGLRLRPRLRSKTYFINQFQPVCSPSA
jgi:hypothetical protein